MHNKKYFTTIVGIVSFIAGILSALSIYSPKPTSNTIARLVTHQNFHEINRIFPVEVGPFGNMLQSDYLEFNIGSSRDLKSMEFSEAEHPANKRRVIALSGIDDTTGKKNQIIISDFPLNINENSNADNSDFSRSITFVSDNVLKIEYTEKR